MKIEIDNMPALKAFVAFLLGFAVYAVFKPSSTVIAAVATFTLATAVLFLIMEKRAPGLLGATERAAIIKGVLFVLMSSVLALHIYSASGDRKIDAPPGYIPEMQAVAKGKVVRIVSSGKNKTRVLLEGWLDSKALNRMPEQKILVNIYGLKRFELGDELLINGKARFPRRAAVPGEFDEAAWLRALDVSWTMRAKSIDVIITGSDRGVAYYSHAISKEIQEKINSLYPERHAGLISALLTGARSGLSKEEQREFSLTGIAHILSVSGLHVGVFAAAIAALLGFISLRWVKFFIFSVLVAAFIAITGFQAPAVRSGVAAILFYYCAVRERKFYPLNVISFALLAYLILSPELIYSASFQMSSAAALGITALYKPFLEQFYRIFSKKSAIGNFLATSFAVSFAAGVSVSPVVAYYFQVFSVVSPLANLTAAPLSSLALIYGMLSVSFYYFAPWAASLFAETASFSLDLLVYFNKFAMDFPLAYMEGEGVLFISLGVSTALIYIGLSKSGRHLAFRSCVALIAVALALNLIPDNKERKIGIYPREQFVAIVVPDSANKKIVLIADRKPHTYPTRDFAMENYLRNDKDFLILAYDGNAGINICDAVKRSRWIKEERASFATLRFLKEKLSLREQLPQVTYVEK